MILFCLLHNFDDVYGCNYFCYLFATKPVRFTERDFIEILMMMMMMIGYGDKMRSYKDSADELI